MANISVIGLGYVGLANSLVLAKKHNVIGIDINEDRVKLLNNRISPIKDKELEEALKENDRTIEFTTNIDGFINSDFIFLALPTNYDELLNYFDTSILDSTIENIISKGKPKAIIIKSTIPIFYTDQIKKKVRFNNIIFMPEFLREGTAYRDVENPDRIIVGDTSDIGKEIMALFDVCISNDYKKLYMGSTEAEAVKLFSNSYLAMRVAYFNELDTFAEMNNLDTADIIKGVSCDHRIGDFYNNPSFGYGGYCFPKDTKQLLANYTGVPNNLIWAIVKSNETRKQYISNKINPTLHKTVGIYKLAMKANSDNCRQSAIIDIINTLVAKNVNIIIYDKNITSILPGCSICNNLEEFVTRSDIILANRVDKDLLAYDISDKIYTRDCFNGDI